MNPRVRDLILVDIWDNFYIATSPTIAKEVCGIKRAVSLYTKT